MKKFIVFGLLLLPSIALGAGFARQPLFLSKSPVTEGDSVHIYVVLSNDDTTAFTGSVVIHDGTLKLGSLPVSMAAGGAQTVSLAWRPSAGIHNVTAELTKNDATVVEKDSATFSVDAKPVPAATADTSSSDSAATVESSQAIQSKLGSLSPSAEQASKPLFTIIDGFRSSFADVLDSQLANTKQKLAATPKSGVIAGSETTQDVSVQNPWGTVWTVLYTLYLYLLTVLRFVIGSAAVFYPLLAILFFYALWRSYRHFRRPSY